MAPVAPALPGVPAAAAPSTHMAHDTAPLPATGFNPEVERVIIRYDLNDYFRVSFGRYHTLINYWNTAFHHGEWLQTSISRPCI